MTNVETDARAAGCDCPACDLERAEDRVRTLSTAASLAWAPVGTRGRARYLAARREYRQAVVERDQAFRAVRAFRAFRERVTA